MIRIIFQIEKVSWFVLKKLFYLFICKYDGKDFCAQGLGFSLPLPLPLPQPPLPSLATTTRTATTTKKIAEAIKLIPEKKEKVRKALESLQTYSSSLVNFTLEWKDLEDHFAAIEKSIEERFNALLQQGKDEDKDEAGEEDPTTAAAAYDNGVRAARPELRSLCANMDAKGLRSYISDNRSDLVAIREELAAAIRCAPDPALLVLDAMEGLYPHSLNLNPRNLSNSSRKRGGGAGEDGETQINRRTCISLLDKLHLVSPDIKPSVREKAKKLATQWKTNIPKDGDNAMEALAFLQFIASYKLVSEFPVDHVIELFIFVSRRKQAIDLIKDLGLTDKLPDLIEKLNSKGRQLDAVKFIYAFNIVDKFPPVPLLKAYITESKKVAQEVRKKGNYSLQAQNEATAKEMGALKSVLKAVEEYELEAEYPRETLVKRIVQLEQKKTDKKRTSTAAAASSSKPQQQLSNKRLRPSSATSAAVIAAANPYSPSIQTQPQLGLADRASYLGVAGPYGLAATGSVYNHGGPGSVYNHGGPGSVYNHGGPGLSGTAMGLGGTRSPPRSYYPPEPLVGSSGLYDRPVTYNDYSLSGLPSSYGSSRYP